jgi:hypothetical protein
MDKNEVSKEIKDFIQFNAEDISNLVNLNPDLLTAFNGVISAIDEQYGLGSLGVISNVINPPQAPKPTYTKNFTTNFVIGDYLNDVNAIYVPFKILSRDGTISDIEYEMGWNFSGFEDTLIIKDIYEVEGKVYYATIYQKDINYFEDVIIKQNYYVFLFEVDALDSHYVDYFLNVGKTKFSIGSYILCPNLPSRKIDDLFENKPKLNTYKTFSSTERMSKVSNDNGLVELSGSPLVEPRQLYFISEVIYVKDVQNVNGKNYYIVDFKGVGFSTYEASEFDDCFRKVSSIKNNDVFKLTTNYGIDIRNYFWFKNFDFQNNYIKYKMTRFDPDMSIVDYLEMEQTPIDFHYDWFEKEDIVKLTPLLSREFIAYYEINNPMITKILGANKSGMSSIDERPIYMSRAIENDGTRKSPTASATLFDLGTYMIGSDGFLWEITEDKNGTKRWKSKENVLKNLNVDIFPNDVPNPLYKFSLSMLQKNESSMEENLGYFDENSDDYKEIKTYLDATKQYLKYYPNIDLNS